MSVQSQQGERARKGRRCRAGRVLACALVLSALGAAGSPAWGQQTTRGREAIAELVQRLGSPEFVRRDAAKQALMLRDDLTLASVERALAELSLMSPEHRARVLEVAREAFRRSPRAAVGISWNSARLESVVISNVYAGFPARDLGLIEPGDEIESIAGVPLEVGGTRQNFSPLILSFDPGESAEFVLLRQGRRMTVQVPFGRHSDLPEAGGLTTTLVGENLRRAWAYRAQRAGLVQQPTSMIDSPLGGNPARYQDSEAAARERGLSPASRLLGAGWPRAVAGGRPTDAQAATGYDEGPMATAMAADGGWQLGVRMRVDRDGREMIVMQGPDGEAIFIDPKVEKLRELRDRLSATQDQLARLRLTQASSAEGASLDERRAGAAASARRASRIAELSLLEADLAEQIRRAEEDLAERPR